jgi:hypothetical protein
VLNESEDGTVRVCENCLKENYNRGAREREFAFIKQFDTIKMFWSTVRADTGESEDRGCSGRKRSIHGTNQCHITPFS